MTMAFLAEMLWKSALFASAALLLLRLLRAQAVWIAVLPAETSPGLSEPLGSTRSPRTDSVDFRELSVER